MKYRPNKGYKDGYVMTYNGDWRDNQPHGNGIETYGDQHYYKG